MSGGLGTNESLEGCIRMVHGVNIKFPVKPYPSQMGMMAKIIKGLSDGVNCLLESPTGTGKSLALLCSSLAWQDSMAEKREKEIQAMESYGDDESENDDCCFKEPKQCDVCGKYKKKPVECSTAPTSPPDLDQKPTVTKETILATNDTTEDDEDMKDFKPASTVFKTPSNRQSLSRGHLKIEYEESEAKSSVGEDLKKVVDESICTCYSFKKNAVNTQNLTHVPTIYYATRTHRQIKQIVKELARTSYGSKRMTILSSRQHSCIHPRVSREKNKNEGCAELLDNSGCSYNDNAKKISHSSIGKYGLEMAWDLEDLINVCHKMKACPYFGSRQLKDQAEIIFCPYNYLIDSSIRQTMQLELTNQVVILDEAHNIEDAARDAASFKITLMDLRKIASQLQSMVEADMNVEHCLPVVEMLNKIANFIQKKGEILDRKSYEQSSSIWTGKEMVAVLDTLNINDDSLQTLLTHFNKLCEELKNGDDDSDEEEYSVRMRQRRRKEKAVFPHGSQLIMQSFFLVLNFLYTQNQRFVNDYRIAIVRTTSYASKNLNDQWVARGRNNYHREVTHTFTLNFWCLSPAVAFSDLAHSRSIILTSGTLSPMQSFQSELGISFPLQLEASHVVPSSQVWVGSISQGPRGSSLLTTYQNTETFAYQDEVGLLLLEICKIMPFGVLCFLPSYKMLEKLSNRWQTTGLWTQLCQQKEVMCEPRASDKADFDDMISSYYETIKQAELQEEDTKPDGALMFAVCRGKISEGIDFAHNNARAVVTIGIPFPNVKDIQVNLKKEYNNRNQYRGLLSGNEWYEIQAYRALNQALGRCIRNRMDWGALILVDTRFGNQPERYMKGISKWVRTKVSHYRNFGSAQSSLLSFTTERQKADAEGKKVQLSLSPNSSILDSSAVNTPQRPECCNQPVNATPITTSTVLLPLSTPQQLVNKLNTPKPTIPMILNSVSLGDIKVINGNKLLFDIKTARNTYNVTNYVSQVERVVSIPLGLDSMEIDLEVKLSDTGIPVIKILKIDTKPKPSPPLSLDANSHSTDNSDNLTKSDDAAVTKLENTTSPAPQIQQVPMNLGSVTTTVGNEATSIKEEGIFQFVDLISPCKPELAVDSGNKQIIPHSPSLFGSDSNESNERTEGADTRKKLDFTKIESHIGNDNCQKIVKEEPVDEELEKENKLDDETNGACDTVKSNVRRGRKRKWSTKGHQGKKKKSGIRYIDSSDEFEGQDKPLLCKICGNELQKFSNGANIKADELPFLMEMKEFTKRAVSPTDDIYVIDSIESLTGILPITTRPGSYNSYWSELSQCCCRLLKCKNCDEYMGVEILSIAEGSSHYQIKSKQVFLFSSVVISEMK